MRSAGVARWQTADGRPRRTRAATRTALRTALVSRVCRRRPRPGPREAQDDPEPSGWAYPPSATSRQPGAGAVAGPAGRAQAPGPAARPRRHLFRRLARAGGDPSSGEGRRHPDRRENDPTVRHTDAPPTDETTDPSQWMAGPVYTGGPAAPPTEVAV